MKITYLITGLGLGGAEVVTLNLASMMVKNGHNVQVVFLNGENYHKGIMDPSIDCVGLYMQKSPVGLLKALFKCKKIIRQFNPDVVHTQMFHANIFGRLLRLITKIKVLINSEHTFDIGGKNRMRVYRYTDFLSDINTNVSKESTERFIQENAFSLGKSVAMYNGIVCADFQSDASVTKRVRELHGITGDELMVLNVGRLTDAKNQANLIQAISMALWKVPNVHLVIVGRGELHDQLQEQICRIGLSEKITLAGARSNIADYYRASDMFVLSSDWEGMPMVILEAMASACPIITTNVGGALETVQDELWIVPKNDSQKLSEKIIDMALLTVEQRQSIGEQNKVLSCNFDFDGICRKWEELYKRGRV